MVAYLRLVSLLLADSKILLLKVTKWTLCQKKKAVRKTNLETPLTQTSVWAGPDRVLMLSYQ